MIIHELKTQTNITFFRTNYLDYSKSAKSSTAFLASSSRICNGGDFIKYAEAGSTGPLIPLSNAILAFLIASIATPAEFGLSSTSNFNSTFSGWSPHDVPSNLIYAHFLSSSQGT